MRRSAERLRLPAHSPSPERRSSRVMTRPLPRRRAVSSRNSSGVRAAGAPSTSMRRLPGARLIGHGAAAT
ncbi:MULTISPECIES: hypothetical protein [Streptomyces]|uniref:hypothetical protein n=1 Tax=Streptomyces TaxID=1883 RepID=UPI001673665B|nr:hypothetical protein [Streptomyces canarius]